jgi:hypothetical protein
MARPKGVDQDSALRKTVRLFWASHYEVNDVIRYTRGD